MTTTPMPAPADTQGRERLVQVFEYLRALHQLRHPAPRRLADQPWALWLDDLPDCPAIRRGASPEDDVVLRVERPVLSAAPPPPEAIAGWLRGLDHPDEPPRVHARRRLLDADGAEREEAFEDVPARPAALEAYMPAWRAWADAERPSRRAQAVFERLYALHGALEREGERLELVLGDGVLHWRRGEDSLHHPVLTTRLALRFDPAVPAFTLLDADRPAELYTALFAGLADVEGRVLAAWGDALAPDRHHPLDGEATTELFRTLIALLSMQGELVAPERLQAEGASPRLARRPVVFARKRTLGHATALEGILEQLAAGAPLPAALLRIVGHEPAAPEATGEPGSVEVLFSKPANPEQHRIAEQLEAHGAVLVQGPPGTGKSYTIGNLIGHLLAQGQTVLVTSHTTKALHVVREHVVPALRPLCVSVLDRDDESRRQLEASVAGIVERLSAAGADPATEAAALQSERRALGSRLAANDAERLEALRGETQPIGVGPGRLTPAEAARLVAESGGAYRWLPGPLSPGAALPLSEAEVLALYQTNALVDADVERALDARLPAIDALPDPLAFAELAAARRALAGARPLGAAYWAGAPAPADEPRLLAVHEAIDSAVAALDGAADWELAVAAAGAAGGVYLQPWEELARRIEAAVEAVGRHQALILEHGPTLEAGLDAPSALPVLHALAAHVEQGGTLGALGLVFKPAWKKLLAGARVNGLAPSSRAHFEALAALCATDVLRAELRARWDRQVGALGGPPGEALGPTPETTAAQFLPRVRALAGWHAAAWLPAEAALDALGFRWEAWRDQAAPEPGPTGALGRLLARARAARPLLAERLDAVRAAMLGAGFRAWLQTLARADGSVSAVAALRAAIEAEDAAAYGEAHARLADLLARGAARARREALLERLEPAAPAWAAALRARVAPHDGPTPPGDAAAAWHLRALAEALDARHARSLDGLQAERESLTQAWHRTTAALIDRRAWASQRARTTLAQQQALIGWLQTVKKIGAGTGKRVPALQAEARRLMAACQGAIPVWIMPLARVAESFDARHTRFDVVIIDEASQSDAMALAAAYLGRRVVVVGDDQQVSPDAVGQPVEEVKQLIDTHLRGIPNAHLYDGQLSVYDLALASFGGSICLTEHFRCVPEIIAFSNHLAYDGRMKALREATSAKVAPAMVAHGVAGATAHQKVNRAEALEVASLIAAAIAHPAYAEATFGVISLVGDDQALLIEALLRRHLEPAALEHHRLLCGNPAQFQGDERDVIWLSMVDSPADGPLPLRQDARFQKRYNVAASRARDQLWVVHSLDAARDLKPGDLRRRLIEHARAPGVLAAPPDAAEAPAERPVAEAVRRRLEAAGYRVSGDRAVGHHRLDLVVEGAGRRRLAIACDGDGHASDAALAAGLERQATLERLGWTFARVRASAFHRDPEAALRPVFERLERLGVRPEGPEPAAAPADDGAIVEAVRAHAARIRQAWAHEPDSGEPPA